MNIRVSMLPLAIVIAFLHMSAWITSPSAPLRVGDELVEQSYADINGDGVRDSILLRRTVTGIYPSVSDKYDYDVVIEILNGKDGKSLFKSQSFHTNALGVFVTDGKLNVVSAEKGPAILEYIETTIYTEGTGPAGKIVDVKKYLFGWTGKDVKVKVMSPKIE